MNALFNYLKITIKKTLPLSTENTYDTIFSEKVGIKVYPYVSAKHIEKKATLEERPVLRSCCFYNYNVTLD